MEWPEDGMLTHTPHYYEIQGRAAEIARALGSPAGGAEHLFLGMLHDGGWPVSVIADLADLGLAEEAVLAIVASPGYTPPAGPRVRLRGSHVPAWGAEVAFELGDSYIGVEHALLAMIRNRETIPARALAGLADLGALEAAVLAAKDAPPTVPDDAVFLPEGLGLDAPLRRAIADALPEGTTFGFNGGGDERTWLHVFEPGGTPRPELTREVLNTALASVGRAPLGS
jgi:hypothetical protein